MTMWLQRTNDRHRSLGEGRGRGDDTLPAYTRACPMPRWWERTRAFVPKSHGEWQVLMDRVDKVTGWNERLGFGYRWSVPWSYHRVGGRGGGSAGFKERQTDESYSIANHPLYTCVVFVWEFVWLSVRQCVLRYICWVFCRGDAS